ncbi:MAG: hypothetical protein JXQ73_26310, partial [Phycisphaerae bacterium]|nr:hypothetical protein [Phycisphaerae bacterium]
TQVASSADLEPDAAGWNTGKLIAEPNDVAPLLGRPEVWIRVVMDNYSGLKTGTSNTLNSVEVKLTLGPAASADSDPQASTRAAWGDLRRSVGWQAISLDWSDPIQGRPPHYYEDADGWLRPPGEIPDLFTEERTGFRVRRAYATEHRWPLSLVMFVKTSAQSGPLMLRLLIRADRDSSRSMCVRWDDKPLARFDVATFFEDDKACFVQVPGPVAAGLHELRIAGQDGGSILVRQIGVIGEGSPAWAEKPSMPQGGSLKALSAYYIPDPAPPEASQAVEGRTKTPNVGLIFKGVQLLYKEHADFGAVRAIVRNNGKVPVRIGDGLLLNGKPIEASYVDFAKSAWDARGVVWHRVRPPLLSPGECGEVYVRFRRRLAGDHAALRIPLINGKPTELTIPYRRPSLTVDYVTTGKDMRTMYVYARREPAASKARLQAVFLDGVLLKETAIFGADCPGNVALAVAKIPSPLKPHSFHVVGIQAEGTPEQVAAQFRVLPFVFPRGSIHTPVSQLKQMNMNMAMWRMVDQASCEKYDVTTTCHEYRVFDIHPRVAYIFGPDEPDAHDNRGGGYDVGLGWHARRLTQSGWQTLVERHAPNVATWLIMNGTVRPLNWSVYGQVADVSCFDPYPITFYGADHAYVRESLALARQCGAPRRMYACLEAYGWGKGQGVPKDIRGPIPAEYRQNVVQAIGAGMKGLTSWVHSSGAGGWQLNEDVAKEIAKVNALLAHIEGDLLLGTPVDLVSCDAGLVKTGTVGSELWPKPRVWVASLLCGPDKIVIAAANHIPASCPDPPKIQPARNVQITVALPDFLSEVKAFEVTDDGIAPFHSTVTDAKASLVLDRIESGRVFVLSRP